MIVPSVRVRITSEVDGMAINTQVVSVGTSPTRLDPTTGSATSQGACAIRHRGTATVFIGNASVTTANGYPIEPGETLSIDLRPTDDLYGVVATGTQTVHVVEVGA